MHKKSDYAPPRARYTDNTTFVPSETRETKLYRKAHKWMNDNPEAMDMFRSYARQMLSRQRRFGIGLLTERVRWECKFEWSDEFKISNNHRAYIARQLLVEIPELADYIVCKRVTHE